MATPLTTAPVIYSTGSGSTEQLSSGTVLPRIKSVTVKGFDVVSVVAQGTDVGCKVFVDGKVIKQARSSVPYAEVICSITV